MADIARLIAAVANSKNEAAPMIARLAKPGNALIPRLAALSAVAGLRELYESDEAHALAAPPSAAELLTLVDRVIRFARAGIEGAR